MSFEKTKFWNQKILSWEENKYKKVFKWFDVNSSVKYRLYLASALLNQMSEGKSLLELGCGSGLLWERINSLNIKNYTGVDFSKTAIDVFQFKVQDFKNRNQVSLFCEDCMENTYPADIVISLGLLDWLSIERIKKMAESYKNSWYLHSFSEKSLSFSQVMHFLYSRVNYKIYFPQYRSADDLSSIFGSKARIYRDPKLSFGAFIYHLPSDVKFKC